MATPFFMGFDSHPILTIRNQKTKYQMMKVFTLLLLLLAGVQIAHAEDATIIIKQIDGNETVIELVTNPIITFDGDNMVVTNDHTRILFPIDSIREYTVSNADTGIKTVSTTPLFDNGKIKFNSLAKGTHINIYTVDGRLTRRYYVDDTGLICIDLTSLPQGLFIINAQNNKIKIINK